MSSVSTTATWSRTAVIHAKCDRYFLAFAAYFFFSTTSIAFNTLRLVWFAFASYASCNLVRFLVRATHSHQETQGSADSVSRCATGSAPSGTCGKRSNTPCCMGMRGINGALDLPLGGGSFHHPLAFSCRKSLANLLT